MAKTVRKSVKMDASPWMDYHTEEPLYKNDLTQSVAMICDGAYIIVDKHGTTTATYATLEELLANNPEFLDWSVSRDLTA